MMGTSSEHAWHHKFMLRTHSVNPFRIVVVVLLDGLLVCQRVMEELILILHRTYQLHGTE